MQVTSIATSIPVANTGRNPAINQTKSPSLIYSRAPVEYPRDTADPVDTSRPSPSREGNLETLDTDPVADSRRFETTQ